MQSETVYITGIRRGIGRALGSAAAARGASIAGCSRRVGHALQDDLILEGAANAFVARTDCTQISGLGDWVDNAFQVVGPPSIVVHNAAVLGPRLPLSEVDYADFQEVVNQNLNAAFNLLKKTVEVAPRDQPVLWVWLTSSVGQQGRAGWGPYAATKAALENMHETFADEIRTLPWSTLLVNPGGTRTDMRQEAYPDEDPESLPSAQQVADTIWSIMDTLRQGKLVSGSRINVREWQPEAP